MVRRHLEPLVGIAFFHKQNGGSKKDPVHGAWGGHDLNGKTYSQFPQTS